MVSWERHRHCPLGAGQSPAPPSWGRPENDHCPVWPMEARWQGWQVLVKLILCYECVGKESCGRTVIGIGSEGGRLRLWPSIDDGVRSVISPAHDHHPVLSDDRHPVLSDDRHPVLSDDRHPVLSDDRHPVLSDDRHPVLSDDRHPVLSDDRHPVLSDPPRWPPPVNVDSNRDWMNRKKNMFCSSSYARNLDCSCKYIDFL